MSFFDHIPPCLHSFYVIKVGIFGLPTHLFLYLNIFCERSPNQQQTKKQPKYYKPFFKLALVILWSSPIGHTFCQIISLPLRECSKINGPNRIKKFYDYFIPCNSCWNPITMWMEFHLLKLCVNSLSFHPSYIYSWFIKPLSLLHSGIKLWTAYKLCEYILKF